MARYRKKPVVIEAEQLEAKDCAVRALLYAGTPAPPQSAPPVAHHSV